MIRAIIFDMDGLLIDSEPLWHKAEIKVFGSVGLQLDEARCRETNGIRIDEVVRIRHAEAPWHDKTLQQVEQEIVAEVQRLSLSEGRALPGAGELVRTLHAAGYPLAVASSSPLPMIRAVVGHLGLDGCFGLLCSAEDERAGKPHPAVYLSAAAQLGVDPRDCLAFEDSVVGVQSALAAGMRVVAVPDAHHFDDARFAQATCKLNSLCEFCGTELYRGLIPRG